MILFKNHKMCTKTDKVSAKAVMFLTNIAVNITQMCDQDFTRQCS